LNVLLDTHVLLWWFTSDARLSSAAQDALAETDNIAYVSAAVAWEIAIKTTSGKLEAHAILSDFHGLLLQKGFRRLAISTAHALRAGQLPLHHRDPFDRMLVAQAQALNFSIVSADTVFDRYGVRRIW
jgi:PIN domain nuclease of toxin-antitoxin system